MTFKEKLNEIIFGWETPAGRAFDVVLILAITGSVAAVMLDSVASIRDANGSLLYALEWAFTLAFSVEYVARLYCSPDPRRYAASFLGVVDLLAILPTYAGLFIAGAHYVMVVRVLRLLRVFRILKYMQYVRESESLMRAIHASHRKIVVFLFFLFTLTIVMGSLMYVIEGEEAGFTSIPTSIYWAIVTLTTVGYGDISPQTPLGQALAAAMMIMGYSIIAVPTGIVTVEMSRVAGSDRSPSCPGCFSTTHDNDAKYCKLCGQKIALGPPPEAS